MDKIKDIEVDYTNFDLKYFEGSDEHKYMVISAEEENLGTILNLSQNFWISKTRINWKKIIFFITLYFSKGIRNIFEKLY